jgi:cytochrome b
MSFRETLFAITDLFGWIIIGLAVVALAFVVIGYVRQARLIVREQGWAGLARHIRHRVLTRRPRR